MARMSNLAGQRGSKASIKAAIQPGGSKNIDEVVTACNEHGIATIFTGMRHFRN